MNEDYFTTEVLVHKEKATQTLVIGTNGTGKTDFLQKFVISELKRGIVRVLIVVPDNSLWPSFDEIQPESIGDFTGARRIPYSTGLVQILYDNFRNGLVIFEDCRCYLGTYLGDALRKLFIRRRQNMTSVIFVLHDFSEIPSTMSIYSSHLILFKTWNRISSSKKQSIANFSDVEEAQKRVNARAKVDQFYHETIET